MIARTMASKPQAPARRIGVLTAWVAERYSQQVLEGVCEVARARGASVVCFSGDWLEPEGASEGRVGSIYDFVSPQAVDGVILLSATSLRSFEHLGAVAKRFAPLPVVSIGLAAAGVPGVVADNETGFRREIEHLIDVHRRRRFAFLAGPARNSDAQIRYGVFSEVLARSGLPLERALVAQGHFDVPSGTACMNAILDRNVSFDAVVSANDSMALGALKALAARGVRVPEDVSVVGFDDEPAGSLASPPLTTVRHPAGQVGRQAAEVLLDAIGNSRVSPVTVVPTEFVTRQSCGCAFQPEGFASYPQPGPAGARWPLDELGQLLRKNKLPGQERVRELVSAFRADLALGRPARFLRALHEALLAVKAEADGLLKWQQTLSLLRQNVLAELTDRSSTELGERLFHEARILAAQVLRRAPDIAQIERHDQWLALTWLAETLSEDEDLDALIRDLEAGAARLGILGWQLALFEGSAEWARVVYNRINGRTAPPSESGVKSESRRILVERLSANEHGFRLVLPLHGRHAPRGFLLFEGRPSDALVFVPLQGYMSANVRRLEREEEVRAAITSVGKLLEGLEGAVSLPESSRAALDEARGRLFRMLPAAARPIDESVSAERAGSPRPVEPAKPIDPSKSAERTKLTPPEGPSAVSRPRS